MFTNTQLPLFGTPDAPGLIELVESGRMVVPRFQRPWQWSHARTLALNRSIARQWPAGALLLMQGTRGFPSSVLHLVDVAPAQEPVYSILDGQQRLTALYLTLRGRHPRHTFFVNIGKVAVEREAAEDDFGFWTNRQWLDTYPTTAHRAQAGVIAIHELRSDNLFFEWVGALPADIPSATIFDARNTTLSGLLNYHFPVSIISAEAPVEVLTSVFVTINQQGLRLGVFDLMVAKSWIDPAAVAPGFDLRDQWDRAIASGRYEHSPASHPKIRDFNLPGVVLLRLIKLLADPAGSVANAGIMELSGAEVRTHLHAALDALEQTLTFLEGEAGAIPESLPTQTGVLPIAYVLARTPDGLSDAGRHGKLLQWFWASTFLQRYGRGGTNTLVVSDVSEIEGWILGEEQEPTWIGNFWAEFTEASLLETETTNDVLLRGIFCLQNLNGARDWKESDPLRSLGRTPVAGSTKPVSRLDQHHVFPSDNPLPDPGGSFESGEAIPDAHDLVVNRVLLLDTTNSFLQAVPPSALEERGIDLTLVETHMIDRATLASWSDFVKARIAAIRAALSVHLPRS